MHAWGMTARIELLERTLPDLDMWQQISTQYYFIHMTCAVLLPCECCAVSKSNVNDLLLRDCKLSPSYIKKYMEWQVAYYPLQLLFDFIQSITMHVIFYQCSSQLCPLAFHFNITNINIVAPCTASISCAATKIYYAMIHAVFREISCNIMSSSCHLSCSMSMLRHSLAWRNM